MFGPKSVVVWNSWDFTRRSNQIASRLFVPLRTVLSTKNQLNTYLATQALNPLFCNDTHNNFFFSLIPRAPKTTYSTLAYSLTGLSKLYSFGYLVGAHTSLAKRLALSAATPNEQNVYNSTLSTASYLPHSLLFLKLFAVRLSIPTWTAASIRIPYLRKINTTRTHG